MDYPSPSFPSPSYPPPAGTPPTYTEEDAKLLFSPPSPPHSPVQNIPLPFCVPQLSTGLESPFVRAYSPALAGSGISQEDWLKFTDGLVRGFHSFPVAFQLTRAIDHLEHRLFRESASSSCEYRRNDHRFCVIDLADISEWCCLPNAVIAATPGHTTGRSSLAH